MAPEHLCPRERFRDITRAELIDAVKIASMHLAGVDRDDVLAFAEKADRVAAGAWQLGLRDGTRCYCPVSGAGVDRLKFGAQGFAIAFDAAVGVKAGFGVVLEVVDDA